MPHAKRKERRWLTVPEFAGQVGVSCDKIRAFIRNGDLVAVDFKGPDSKRPRLRIDRDEIEAFVNRRTVGVVKTHARRRRKSETVTQYV